MIYQEDHSPTGRFLVLGLRAELTASERDEFLRHYQALGDKTCFEAAQKNQVAALIAHSLRQLLPAGSAPRWRALAAENLTRVEAMVAMLLSVTQHFDRQQIKWAMIENGGTLFGSEQPLETFCAGDFDLLVERARWSEVVEIFARQGFFADNRRARPTNRVEFVRRLEDGASQWLNAGFMTFDRMWVPLPVNDLGQSWLQRRVRSRKNPEIWVLRPEDALALVAMHTSLHSFVRAPGLRLHVDVDRVVQDNPIDWPEFIEQVRLMRASTRAFVSLSMARGLLGTPIPDAVLQTLAPGRARWAHLQQLLAANGTVADGTPKLARLQTVWLDLLIEERSPLQWACSVLWPSRDWLLEHFGDADGPYEPLLRLQLQRYRQMLNRWKPA